MKIMYQLTSTLVAIVAPLLVLLLVRTDYTLASDSEQNNLVENLIRNPPEYLDAENCFIDMLKADLDGSGFLEKNEYLSFINIRGERFCWYQETLTLEQHGAFHSLACLCYSKEVGNKDDSCCLLENATIPVSNVLYPANRTEEESLWMTVACIVTDTTIVYQCHDEDQPPTTLPTALSKASPLSLTGISFNFVHMFLVLFGFAF